MVDFELKPDGKRIRKRIVQRTVARIFWRSNHLSIEQTEPEFNGENAETLVPQQGVGRGVVYAFCEMHNKCTKCTTDILRNKPRMSKTARKTRGISTKSASLQQVNAVAKTTLQTTTQIPISSATRQVLDLLKAEPLLSGDNAAQRLGLTRDGFYYHVKILRKAVGLRHTGGTKRGRWEVEKS